MALLPMPTTHEIWLVGPALHTPSAALKVQKPGSDAVVALQLLLNVETSAVVPLYCIQLVGLKVVGPTVIAYSM